VPGAEGIAIRTSSGSTSSSTRSTSAAAVVPRTLRPCSSLIRACGDRRRGTRPDAIPVPGCASARARPAARPHHRRRSAPRGRLAHANGSHPAVGDQLNHEAGADQEGQREQEEQRDDAGRQGDRGLGAGDRAMNGMQPTVPEHLIGDALGGGDLDGNVAGRSHRRRAPWPRTRP